MRLLTATLTAYRAIAWPVAVCALMCTLAVAVAMRSRDDPKPVAPTHELETSARVIATAQRVQTLAVRARLDQQLAELHATLELMTGVDEPCRDCGAVDARERLRVLKERQAELIRERDRVRASIPRKSPGVRISPACLDNPLAKDCW
ncbi:MAG: hypothetical protein H0T46_24430 [Deltaproteobacteria bacterium]|nr:hypothetical protein [Deltaproteobacteria bacterium]